MARIKKLLLPNRYDCLYCVLGTLCFLAILAAFVAHFETVPRYQAQLFLFLLAAVGICLFAIGVVIAFKKHSWQRVRVLGLTAAVLPPIVLLAFIWKNPQLIKQIAPGAGVLSRGQQAQITFQFASVFWLYVGTLLLPLASWMLFSVVRQGPSRRRR